MKLLGTPLGHAAYVQGQSAMLSTSHDVLLKRIQAVLDLQVALLLVFCAASRTNNFLRVVHPDLAGPFAEQHDAKAWRCLQRFVGIEGDSLTEDMARLPLCFGGLGLRKAVRTSLGRLLAHPPFRSGILVIITLLSDHAGNISLSGANVSLLAVSYNVPNWEQIADGLRPGFPVGGSRAWSATPWVPRQGWQFPRRHAAGDGEVPPTARWCSFHLSPHIAFDSLRRSSFPGVVASPPRCSPPHGDAKPVRCVLLPGVPGSEAPRTGGVRALPLPQTQTLNPQPWRARSTWANLTQANVTQAKKKNL